MQVFKFRGIDQCYIAKVLNDDSTGITYDTPVQLFPIGEVGKTTSSDSATDYADNKAMLIINSEGADEISLTGFGISLENLALITGKTFDSAKLMFHFHIKKLKNVNFESISFRISEFLRF